MARTMSSVSRRTPTKQVHVNLMNMEESSRRGSSSERVSPGLFLRKKGAPDLPCVVEAG